MPFFHDRSRTDLRRAWCEAWRRRKEGLPLEPLQVAMADVIELHPEYAAWLASPDALERDWRPEDGATNPFLHMGLHMTVREQVGTDRPAGIAAALQTLAARTGSRHDAEHAIAELLASALWDAQRAGRAPDERAYLEAVRRLAAG